MPRFLRGEWRLVGLSPRPSLPGGSAGRGAGKVAAAVVSIHASRCREAMPPPRSTSSATSAFQSTPPVAGRRCSPDVIGLYQLSCFNPRLPLPGGDAQRRHGNGRLHGVSIHASRCREAMPAVSTTPTTRKRFQSTPPVAGRRCGAQWREDGHRLVSIHASRCREAMLRRRHRSCSRFPVSIHASRCREAMRAARGSPARRSSFNPRLPLPGGDARRWLEKKLAVLTFQSTPPVAGRRCAMLPAACISLNCFNPRLPLPGGDAPSPMHAACPWRFQSTPPVAGRRCLG